MKNKLRLVGWRII